MNPGLQSKVCKCLQYVLVFVHWLVHNNQYFQQYHVCLLISKPNLGLLIVNLSDIKIVYSSISLFTFIIVAVS